MLTAGFWGLTPSRHSTSPFWLMAQTGTCSMLPWARHGIREMSLRRRGGTCSQGPLSVILHFLCAQHMIRRCGAPTKDAQRRLSAYLVHLLRLTKSFMVLCPWKELSGNRRTEVTRASPALLVSTADGDVRGEVCGVLPALPVRPSRSAEVHSPLGHLEQGRSNVCW